MGIFTKNQDKNEENKSSVQFSPSNDNNANAETSNSQPQSSSPTPRKTFSTSNKTQAQDATPSAPTPPKQDEVTKKAYGIDDAIELMRQMPDGNIEVIITVVKKTLESTNIRVSDIISDAQNKESSIKARTKQLETEIKDLEEKIAKRNSEISELQTTLDETVQVREHLQISEPKNKSPDTASQSIDMRKMKPKNTEKSTKQAQVGEQVAREVAELAMEIEPKK